MRQFIVPALGVLVVLGVTQMVQEHRKSGFDTYMEGVEEQWHGYIEKTIQADKLGLPRPEYPFSMTDDVEFCMRYMFQDHLENAYDWVTSHKETDRDASHQEN